MLTNTQIGSNQKVAIKEKCSHFQIRKSYLHIIMLSSWKQGGETTRACSTWFHAETDEHTIKVYVRITFPYSIIGRSIEFDKFGFICPLRTLWAKSKWKITTYNYAQVTLWLEIVKFDCGTINYMSIFHKRITLITMNAYMYP